MSFWKRSLAGIVCITIAALPAWGEQPQPQSAPQAKQDESAQTNSPQTARFRDLLERFDTNGDGKLTQEEVRGPVARRFNRLDRNSDGLLTAEDLPAVRPAPAGSGRFNAATILKRFDADRNGLLEGDELPPPLQRRLATIDQNEDGKLSRDELEQFRPSNRDENTQPGEKITPPAKGERYADTLKAGDQAPDFTLPAQGKAGEVTLSSFKGKKPVVLVFGSYT